MRDARPVALLVLAQGLAVLALAGWWAIQPAADRLHRLTLVQLHEHVEAPVPEGLVEQVTWLWMHRLAQLQGSAALLALALSMGIVEGTLRRRRAVLGGFLLTTWTCGVVTLALVPGAVLGALVGPVPLAPWWVPCGLSGLVGVGAWAVACGRPFIP
jgi:hypothetical protein